MLDPRDRQDMACLGLMVLVYGLAGAPVLHAVVDHAGGLGNWEGASPPTALRTHGHGHSHRNASGGLEDPGHSHEDAGEHGHGSSDEDAGHPHQHAPGSVEHLRAMAVTYAAVLAPVVWWVTLKAAVFLGPLRLPGAPPRLTAMPQGP
ncbi:hypothetical protein [Stigmatella aurantiaca]|uniref:Conserved uncharacterized protein n=2 Tax=Stigmatella aurantiaca (strain DW4/3-1) TaxID=378806 RepID=E3FRU7_STIAD|nr:hypothetical protein [Stigmatella aurantiaca]ADO68282.1 conserved uncharacterized protein [Stigmatella aurantiaca DW4/3-1]